MSKILITSTAALAICLVASCNRNSNSTPVASPTPTASAATASALPASPQLAAAEPFEALAETAFSAPAPELGVAVVKAEAAATAVRHNLPADMANRLTAQMGRVRAAHQAGNRAEIALASVEAYRTLVSAAPPAKVPTAVNLLDYAGFRYQADLRAQPVRWNDAAQALLFARTNWVSLAPQVSDVALKTRVGQALDDLTAAAARHDRQKGNRAATAELGLVDELEVYFNARTSS
jgi:hypothetical protein